MQLGEVNKLWRCVGGGVETNDWFINRVGNVKPRLHERFFARAGDAIFSNFVASPARDENRTCNHPRTGDATGEKIARKKSPELKFSQLFALVMRLKSI